MTARHYCPGCGAGLVSEPIGAPLRCKHCDWHLVSRAKWQTLTPRQQGYVLYAQGDWPTSELTDLKNPYDKGTAAWEEFREGEAYGARVAQDSEE